MSLRIAAQLYAESWGFTVHPSVGAPVPISIPDGTYYILDDGSAEDLLDAINDACTAAGVNVSMALVSGFVRITIGAGVTAVVFAGDDLSYALGFRTAISPIVSVTASYRPAYTFDGEGLAVEDLEQPEALASKAMTDTRVYTSHYGQRDWRRVRIFFSGQPRSSDPGEEYYALQTLFEVALSKGHQFRYYPDTSIYTGAYNELLPARRSYGYQVYTHQEPQRFAPSPRVSGWYGHFDIVCTWHREEEDL